MMYSLALLCYRVPETSFNHLIHISIQAEENLNGTMPRRGVGGEKKKGEIFLLKQTLVFACAHDRRRARSCAAFAAE